MAPSELYVVLEEDGSYLRTESLAARAERARLEKKRVYPLAIQKTADGYIGVCDQGTLIVTPGKKEWRPAGSADETQKTKKEKG